MRLLRFPFIFFELLEVFLSVHSRQMTHEPSRLLCSHLTGPKRHWTRFLLFPSVRPAPRYQKTETPSHLVLSCLDQLFGCQSLFQLRDLFHLSALPSSWALVCHKLTSPVCMKAPSLFHGGRLVGCKPPHPQRCLSHPQSRFLVCTLWKHSVPSPSVLLMTVLTYSSDVFSGTVGVVFSQTPHLCDRCVCRAPDRRAFYEVCETLICAHWRRRLLGHSWPFTRGDFSTGGASLGNPS